MNDDAEIRNMVSLYAQCLDGNDPDAFVDLFTEDGHFVSRTNEHSGRDALRQFVQRTWANRGGKQSRRMSGNVVVRIVGDTAHATSDNVVFEKDGEAGWRVSAVSRYVDTLVRRDDKWLFREKRVER